MAKEAYYFTHDKGARNDPKMIKLLMRLGQAGKGIYWDLVEMLHEEDGYLMLSECETYSFAMRSECDLIKSVIFDFGLFENDGEKFWSNSVLKRLGERKDKSIKASKSANERWKNANALRSECEGNAIKEKKGKESKEKEKKIKENKEEENNGCDVPSCDCDEVNYEGEIFPKPDEPYEHEPLEVIEPQKEKNSGQKEKGLHAQVIEAYDQFYRSKTGCPYKFQGGADGKAVKEIIAYLQRASNDKSDQGVLNSWSHILASWGKLEDFYQKQTKLTQINSNISNLIYQLKNGTGTKKNGAADISVERTDAIIDAMFARRRSA